MELTRLKKACNRKKRAQAAKRQARRADEAVLEIVRENKTLRERVEQNLKKVYDSFLVASALMSKPVLEQSLMFPNGGLRLK